MRGTSDFSIGEFSRDRVSHVSEVVWVTLQVKYDPQGNGVTTTYRFEHWSVLCLRSLRGKD